MGASPTFAETNVARAGIGGVANGTIANGDGTGPARITINSSPLLLIKQARTLAGTLLPDGAAVVPGQEIWFVLYVDNSTPNPASDVRVTDLLDETQFALVGGTFEECLVPSGSSSDAIWQGTWSGATGAIGAPDDFVSVSDTGGPPAPDRITLGAVPGQVNLPFPVPGASIHAVRFRVRVL